MFRFVFVCMFAKVETMCLNFCTPNSSFCVFLFLAWQQHDVQELCRVMFDALEQKWKQTEQVGEIKKFVETSDKHNFSSQSKEPPRQWKQKGYCWKSEMGQ